MYTTGVHGITKLETGAEGKKIAPWSKRNEKRTVSEGGKAEKRRYKGIKS